MADTTPTTIASTVASLPGSAAERFGSQTAARFKKDGEWREMSYAEMGEAIDEIALGLVDLGHRARRPRVHPGRHAARVDAARASAISRPAPSSCRSIRPTAPYGVRVGGRQLRRSRDLLRERGPAREDRGGARRAARPRARDRDRRGRRRAYARRAARARPRARPRRARASPGGGEPRGPVHDRLHVGHHRPAQGRRAHPRQRDGRVPDGRGARVRRARRRQLPVPAPGPRVRADHACWPPSTRAPR